MIIDELKCIEELLTIISEQNNSDTIVDKINRNELFNQTRLTLFTEITINSLIANYHNKPSFSIEKIFNNKLEVGTGNYIECPRIDPRYIDNKELFIEKIIEALKHKEYEIDEDNNIIISSDEIEVTISQSWLYVVSSKYQKDTYEKLFLYNKSTPRKINNKEQLERFIKQSKTFICKQMDMKDQEFSSTYKLAKEQTKNVLRNYHEEKLPLDRIISYFESFMPRQSEYKVEKYHLPNPIYIVKKANLHKDFYSLPFEKQEKLIMDWTLEYKNNNQECNRIIEQLLISPDKIRDIPKSKLITGLFNLYLSLIGKTNIDFNNISLTDIKLKEYINEKVINYSQEQKAVIKVINGLDNSEYKQGMKIELDRINSEIANIDQEDISSLEEKRSELAVVMKKYRQNEDNIQEYKDRLSTLTNLINNINNSGISEIAFDNPVIIELIKSASFNGTIILNPLDSKELIIEEQSSELGKDKFLAEVDISGLINLIGTINCYIEERQPRVS